MILVSTSLYGTISSLGQLTISTNNVTVFTALETVKVLLDVLEEITFGVSTIDAK